MFYVGCRLRGDFGPELFYEGCWERILITARESLYLPRTGKIVENNGMIRRCWKGKNWFLGKKKIGKLRTGLPFFPPES